MPDGGLFCPEPIAGHGDVVASTIYDIARACGISHVTVSRALQNHPNVNAQTRERILCAAKELGYRPMHSARALRKGQSNVLCIVLPDLSNPSFVEFARAVEEGALGRGYQAVISEYAWDTTRERACLEGMLERRYDAVVAFVSRFEPLRELLNEAWEMRLPCVVPGLPLDVGSGKLDGCRLDMRRAVEQAVEHLVDLGHREIVFVADWPAGSGAGVDRLNALQAAFVRRQLPYDEASIVFRCTGQELQGGYDAAMELMRREPRPTAIVGVNDYLIAGVARALAEFGLRVPQDVSLVGADNTWIARYWPVSLTSIDLKTRERAEAALEILFERLNSNDWGEPRRVSLEAGLVIRESTGPARRNA